MSYIQFKKEQLANFEYSISREVITSNNAGSYLSTTITGCNTRKYHGLLVCPVETLGNNRQVLLSTLDVTLINGGEETNLGIHRYAGGIYFPAGNKYISNIQINKGLKITYNAGGMVLTAEIILAENEQHTLIRYTLAGTAAQVTMRLRPFLAFRSVHTLCQANLFANTRIGKAENGISSRLYPDYPDLFLQFNKKNEFIHVPDWYYNIEYLKERNRGYDYLEDLFVPGYFELPVKKGESVIFSAGTSQLNPASLKKKFTAELEKKEPLDSFQNTLKAAASRFITRNAGNTDIIAGFHWYDSMTRYALISLPGLSLVSGNPGFFTDVLDTYRKHLVNGLLPDSITNEPYTWLSSDVPLWFIWAVQEYYKMNGNARNVWEKYGESITGIIEGYRKSVRDYIKLGNDLLIAAEKDGTALTWMNSSSGGRPVVPREGKTVEVNALWYNAICFALELAEKSGDSAFIRRWKTYPGKVGESFLTLFSDDRHEGLADCAKNSYTDWSVRPNMVIAAALDYTPLSREKIKSILALAKKQLLTPRGLRTLSPDHLRYRGVVEGNPDDREQALHQGAVWPWLIQFFVEGYLKIHRRGGLPFIKEILKGFEEELTDNCIGTISETYNGTPPYKAKGAVSFAASVAAVICAYDKMKKFT